MEPSRDELAGVADLFSAVTRDELHTAFQHLAARTGDSLEEEYLTDQIDAALDSYYLVAIDQNGSDLLVPGPTALPVLPPQGEDLPHLMDITDREISKSRLAATVEKQFRADAASAIDAADADRAATLLDVCYEIEAWAAIDLSDIRTALEDLA